MWAGVCQKISDKLPQRFIALVRILGGGFGGNELRGGQRGMKRKEESECQIWIISREMKRNEKA